MDMPQDEMREILEEFFVEAGEGLDELEQDLIKLETIAESGDDDGDVIDRVFRNLHTLKGGAGFLGLQEMAKLAHAGENLLDEIRGGRVQVTTAVMDALLKTNDMLKELLDISRAGDDPAAIDFQPLVATLVQLVEDSAELPQNVAPKAAQAPAGDSARSAPAAVEKPLSVDVPAVFDTSGIDPDLLAEIQNDPQLAAELDTGEDDAPADTSKQAAPAALDTSGIDPDLLAEIQNDPLLAAELDTGEDDAPVAAAPAATPVEAAPAALDTSGIDPDLLAEIQNDPLLAAELDTGEDDALVQAAPVAAVAEPLQITDVPVEVARGEKPQERRDQKQERRGTGEDRRQQARRTTDAVEATIRIETSRLDKVMNLVGELVLARNSLSQGLNMPETREALAKAPNVGAVMASIEQLSRVTQDIQMSVLSTRMQPIKRVFDKIPRQVRELKSQLGKELDLIIEGEGTEVDKTLVEELADPMVHLIRNSLDHGIEQPEERKRMGKNPTGTLSIRAFYEGNNIVIRIQDDGKGIDPTVIRRIAVKKGVVDELTAAKMTDKEAIRMIFAPGFSTAEKISDVSGRGVGMDVVNSKIMAVKGHIDLESEVGIGTTVSIYLPLTLAIIQALVVQANHEGFAIPIADISEVIKYSTEDIHKVNDRDVIELRGKVLPLFYLHEMTEEGEPLFMKAGDDARIYPFIVVIREGNSAMGVVVDKLIGQEEAVVKPVTELFAYNKAISGATIMGDGTVHMILDVPFLMKSIADSNVPQAA